MSCGFPREILDHRDTAIIPPARRPAATRAFPPGTQGARRGCEVARELQYSSGMNAAIDTLRLAGAPYRARVAVSDEIRRLEREHGPSVRVASPGYARCCNRGVITFRCTCSHVVTCLEHGTRHHGTHD
jgi:hypothetical protein